MEVLFTMIGGLWSAINSTIIYQDNNISFTIGTVLIAFFLIYIAVSFIKIVIVGSGDKTHSEFKIGRKEKIK